MLDLVLDPDETVRLAGGDTLARAGGCGPPGYRPPSLIAAAHAPAEFHDTLRLLAKDVSFHILLNGND